MQQEKDREAQIMQQEKDRDAQIIQQERDREAQINLQEAQIMQQEKELAKLRMEQDFEKEKLIIQAELERERILLKKMKLESKTYVNDDSENEIGINSKVRKLKQYGDAIRNMVSKMSENTPHEFLPFVTKFDQVFETLAVPNELRVSLITPY